MSQWLTSAVAKIKKLGQGRSAPRPQWLARPGVEALGGGSSFGGGRRLPVRPEVEQLEERRLMSSSGVISAVTDNSGYTSLYALGTDHQVYRFFPETPYDTWAARTSAYRGPSFRQISAGLNDAGQAVCYAISTWDSHVWIVAGPNGGERDLGYTATEISATRNNECFAIHTNYPSDLVGIYSASSNSWFSWNGPWGALTQITTGVDRTGRDEVYLLNQAQQVYRLDNGTYWVLPMHATQISAVAGRNWADTDLFYTDTSSSRYAYHYDGGTSKMLGQYVTQISAGLDRYGNEVLYSIDMNSHVLVRHDLSGNAEIEFGAVSQISAAGNDMVFAVAGWDTSVWVFDRDWSWYSYWASTGNWGGGGWHSLNGTTASPYYAPLAA